MGLQTSRGDVHRLASLDSVTVPGLPPVGECPGSLDWIQRWSTPPCAPKIGLLARSGSLWRQASHRLTESGPSRWVPRSCHAHPNRRLRINVLTLPTQRQLDARHSQGGAAYVMCWMAWAKQRWDLAYVVRRISMGRQNPESLLTHGKVRGRRVQHLIPDQQSDDRCFASTRSGR